MESGEEVVVLKCQNDECGWENPADSIFCRHCGSWLVRQWQAVLVKSRSPVEAYVQVGTSLLVTFSRRFSSNTPVNILIRVVNRGKLDILAYAEDPNGNVIGGNPGVRIRASGHLQFQTFVPGEYRIVLDNTFSWFTAKRVRLIMNGF